MLDADLTDFYQGWIIEVIKVDGGFQSLCYNPHRERLSDREVYDCDLRALAAARHLVDYSLTCYTLANFLRETYELGRLGFDEWQSLNQSLTRTLKVL